MRIGFVSGEYPPMEGGIGAFTDILAKTIAVHGHTISVFSSKTAHSDDPLINLVTPVEAWNLNSLRAVKVWTEAKHLNIVNLQFQTAAYGMSPWVHFLPQIIRHIPVVTTFHDLRFPYLFPKAGPLRDWVVMHLARTSDGVIVTNHEDLERLKSLPNKKLIPIGSNILAPLPENFDASHWRRSAGSQANDFLIAYFGLVNHSKGLHVLLQSIADLRAQNIPARMVIIGGSAGSSDPTNAAYKREIDAQIEKIGLRSFVHETGFISDEAVGAFLASSDITALPFLDGASYRRGSLMAAIHYGCAIVSTQAVVEIPAFKNGENMRLVASGDSDALTQALSELYYSPELRQTLKQGATTLAKQFQWDSIAHETVAFFDQAVGA